VRFRLIGEGALGGVMNLVADGSGEGLAPGSYSQTYEETSPPRRQDGDDLRLGVGE